MSGKSEAGKRCQGATAWRRKARALGREYLDPFYPEAQGVGGAHGLPPLHVARLGDAPLGVLLGSGAFAVHLHHFLVQVFSRLGPFSRSNKLLLQVCPETAGQINPSGAGTVCLHTVSANKF